MEYIPTEEEIQEGCRKIQRGWSLEERMKRKMPTKIGMLIKMPAKPRRTWMDIHESKGEL